MHGNNDQAATSLSMEDATNNKKRRRSGHGACLIGEFEHDS